MNKPVILTGIRANNNLTIANLFGALMPMVNMAKQKAGEYQLNMFIPDLHSFTTPIDHQDLYEQIIHNAKVYYAAGLPFDNDNIQIYRQSFISAHSELTWILDCFTGFGEMGRMIQFKDKSSGLGGDRTSVGLFNYPVLMAADILLYGATYIPVGEDQNQHLEFTRNIAQRMNNQFGELFVVPEETKKQLEFFNKEDGLRIRDLQNPEKKMSKSDESGKGVIYMSDTPAAAKKKIMSAATDSIGRISYDRENQLGICNLLDLLSLVRNQPIKETVAEFEGVERYGDFKKVVAEEIANFLEKFQSRLEDANDELIMDKLIKSESLMRAQANETLYNVQKAVGLRGRNGEV